MGTALGSDPPGTSHSRRAGSTLWPCQACVSQASLSEAMPPAVVSPKSGAHSGQGGHAREERILAITGHPMPSPAGEVRVRSQQGSLGEKKLCSSARHLPRGIGLEQGCSRLQSWEDCGGLGPACSLHWLPFRSEGLWVEGASATMI